MAYAFATVLKNQKSVLNTVIMVLVIKIFAHYGKLAKRITSRADASSEVDTV